MNTTIKKQNRFLLAALIVLLTAAAVLIAVTGGANKKEKSDPPVETSSSESRTGSAESSAQEKTTPGRTKLKEDASAKSDGDETARPDRKIEQEREDSASLTPADEEAAAVQPSSDVLPTFTVPVDNFVIKDYSADVPVFSYTMNDYRIHGGVDIACSAGTPVYAAADGFVCEIDHDPMMGVTVGVQHSGGAVTRYRGLSEESMELVTAGEEVTRGQVIGASGETALIESAEEAHVHFELSINGEPVDPGDYMKLTHLSDVYEG